MSRLGIEFDGVRPVSNDRPAGGALALKLPDQPAVMSSFRNHLLPWAYSRHDDLSVDHSSPVFIAYWGNLGTQSQAKPGHHTLVEAKPAAGRRCHPDHLGTSFHGRGPLAARRSCPSGAQHPLLSRFFSAASTIQGSRLVQLWPPLVMRRTRSLSRSSRSL